MTDELVTIAVDGHSVHARKGAMLMEVTDDAGIYVPRFCYHKKLSIAANCRMCLVEVQKAPKPLPACATPVMDGMKVFTRSPLALEAQKATMEFLLINHPLDCPICDQGGECELQDLAMAYGSDVSRYVEGKRVVQDKDIGPLIRTDMTRCIHCTRCVRFGEEIAGLRELGATGRGEHMEIGTYIENAVTSEMSGNVIDLCPVGALTSKPYRYSARAWELRQREGIAPHDAMGSNIYIHLKGNRVKRVVPKENEAINEVWLSDRDRYSYEGLYSQDRLSVPMIKEGSQWREADWETALDFVASGLKRVADNSGPQQLGALSSPTATIEELYLFQKLMRGLGCDNIDHRLQQTDFSDQDQAPVFPWLGQAIAELEGVDAALLVGSNVRKEQPIANHRLRKAALRGANIMVLNPVDFEFNFEPTHRIIVSPGSMVSALAGVAKASAETHDELDARVIRLLGDVEIATEHRAIAKGLSQAASGTLLLGDLATGHPNFSHLRFLGGIITSLSSTRLGYLPAAANSCGAWLAGAVPHRGVGGALADTKGLDAQAMLDRSLRGYVLLGLELELDCCNPGKALAAVQKAEFVVSLTAYRTPSMDEYADCLLPISLFAETSGSYVNAAGDWQSFAAAATPPGETRPAWKVLRVLGNLCGLEGFDYLSSEAVQEELRSLVGETAPNNNGRWMIPEALGVVKSDGLELVCERSMYALDPVLRRAPALQATQDNGHDAILINERLAASLKLSDGAEAALMQNGMRSVLPVVVDPRVPDRTVLVHDTRKCSRDLGSGFGTVTLEACYARNDGNSLHLG